MAPKVAAAAPKAKAEVKKPRKENPEDEIPKVPQPDREVHDETVREITNAIEALQVQVRAISNEIQGKSSGKDEFLTKKNELRFHLDECSKKIDALQEQKSGILGQVGDRVAENKEMKAQLNKMKKSLGYTSEDAIDERIASIEYRMWTESITLKEEKKLLAEIADLKRNKPKVSEYNKKEEEMKGFDPSLSLKDQLTKINEQMGLLKEEKKGYSAAFGQLISERQNVTGDMKGLFDQRDELNQEIQAKIAERQELKDEFRQSMNKYNDYTNAVRRSRQDRAMEEKRARQAEWEKDQRMRKADKLDTQPHLAETTLLEQTIAFCKGLLPKDKAGVEEKVTKAVTAPDSSMTVLMKKEDREEEFYFAPTKKKTQNKSNKVKKTDTKAIKHNVETFQLFEKLKIDAPITTDDLPATLEALEAQMAGYNEKIIAWEEQRDELKRKILEGGFDPDAQQEGETVSGVEPETVTE
uniref:Uncharacterized protein n=1 Tax=Noctiluca scintillans TaxID=2966 RepID=A0A7S1AJB0_NOCSC|mmetsp:Transcript_47859/g.126696  ORF Transcript_47859/g.126696 Transcript_47859/m.126696 type:complete len:469 (+) Transcript_47859:62-1468(+)|eukprot:CAMPEP_0194509498 /NCGR_PEP_ID=MMETSP0253-20130528/40321_1 /TAXON_ID=2966 /ORGANISM="Noctiluca scintillans" /LENGTH=468 /DNA_ID=CAMNT_0039352655 /DNA_START=56 /DNA_END=1462 /DNA_ORIENTATION=-